ncbi:MAG TPA: haloacid dehalogenase type II [Gammaproteobacteria bacterium]|nr:haloacid dehalogenase type II [Gammaproteobacteria bacterium]
MALLVFDLNETLLDLAGLDPAFEALFGEPRVRGEWFGQVVGSALTLGVTGGYRPFTEIAASALAKMGRIHGVAIGEGEVARVAEALRRLPPHPEVPAALAGLRSAGHRLAVLTNSPPATLAAQLTNAGLDELFPERFSVAEFGALKPAPAVYRGTAQRLGVEPAAMTMVAAHGWDLAGAMTAGCRTAFIARPGQVPEDLFAAPDVAVPSLDALAGRL